MNINRAGKMEEERMKIVARPPGSAVRRLLSEAELPTSDITPEKLETFFGCESDGKL